MFYSKTKEKTTASFTSYEKQVKVPFVIYVHFEALREPCTKPRSKLVLIQKPCGFSYSVRCSYDDQLSKYGEYLGEDCAKVFWKRMEAEANYVQQMLNLRKTPKSLTTKQRRDLEKAETCYFCHKELLDDRYADFSELTGKFLGACHQECRAKSKIPYFIPVIMHNLSKCGAHFVLQGLTKKEYDEVKILKDSSGQSRFDKSGESCIGFTRKIHKNYLRFIDSGRFLDTKSSEIEDFEKILDDSRKIRVREEFESDQEFALMKRKGFFPYNHLRSFDQFSEGKFPNQDGFYNLLQDRDISDEDYKRAKAVWKIFKCETLGEYCLLYLKSTVLLLEDIFENFRQLCLEKYQLDPAHYFTVASLAWDAMLKYTEVELEILQDKRMIDMIKSSIRGGILQCSKRLAKANNKYCDSYNRNEPPNSIICLDANNLAGWAMSQHLPFSEFSWLTPTEIQELGNNIQKLKSNADYGYILEVDIAYPKELHIAHNDLPFCCDRIPVPSSSSSSKSYSYYKNDDKPTLNLYPKEHYVIDYRNLQQCLENKLQLVKIHRVLRFRQCQWLKPYITYNTKLRANAKNDFEVKLYKLLNNSVYGKTIQKSSTDKPIYAGFSILELSKNFMYNFHYKVMVPKYRDRINLLYTDTDCFIYEIGTNDFYDDLRNDPKFLKLFDTSNLPARWDIPPQNKKVVGKMKDEYDGKIISHFCCTGSKMYCLVVEGEEVKKAVGVPKYVKAKYVTYKDYEICVLNGAKIERTILNTVPKNHELQTFEMTKTILSPGDTKRCVLEDKINTLALGFQYL